MAYLAEAAPRVKTRLLDRNRSPHEDHVVDGGVGARRGDGTGGEDGDHGDKETDELAAWRVLGELEGVSCECCLCGRFG